MEEYNYPVLLIEDNHDHALLVKRNFKVLFNHDAITHIDDGEKALKYLQSLIEQQNMQLPYFILLDLRLPKIDGIQILKYIKSSHYLKNIPVIILTTSDAERDIAGCYNANANSFLMKPIDYDQFVGLMRDLGLYWFQRNKQAYQTK